jgi:hypothetical protein
MRDWRAAVRGWEKHPKFNNSPGYKTNQSKRSGSFDTDDFFNAALMKSYSQS